MERRQSNLVTLSKKELKKALEDSKGNERQAATLLGIHPDTFRRHWLKSFGENPSVTVMKSGLNFKEDQMEAFDEFIQKLLTSLKSKKLIVDVPYNNPFEGKQIEQACLVISDMHIGKKNIFTNVDTGEQEITYDMKRMINQVNNLVTHTNKVINLLSSSYQIDDLWIPIIGDILDNDIIYPGQQFGIETDVGKQLWMGVKVITDMLRNYLNVFKRIHIINIPGNHGRLQAHYEASPASRNWDYHLGKILEVVFSNEPRIDFVCPDSWFYLLEINNWKYYLHHGSSVYSWMGIPFYGIQRQSKSRRVEMGFDNEIIGHFHQRMDIPIGGKKHTMVNGAWIPKDTHAWERYGILSYPEQLFFGISRQRPITWAFNIDLLNEKQRGEFFTLIYNNNHKKTKNY